MTFIQQHTGIYTTTHWHLYNNTLAFIQVMSFIHFLLNSSWHSAMNSMQTNKMCAVHGRVLPNFSFSFLNSSWHSAMNGMQTNKMCAIHGRVLPNFSFSFLNSSWHSAMNGMRTNKMCAVHGRVLPNFSFSFLNSSWHSAMNGMRNLNACHPWQSAAQFFSFLLFFKAFILTQNYWHLYKKLAGIYTRKKHAGIYTRQSVRIVCVWGGYIYTNSELMAFIQET